MLERVVIVDDEEGILALLRRVLRSPGREVEIFPSPLHALPAIRRNRPDVVVTDLHMPGMSGPEFIRELRAEFGDRIGIIVITAFPALVADADAVANGVGAYLRKPFTDLELLRSTVTEVIEAARRSPRAERDAAIERDLAEAQVAKLQHRASLSRADAVLQAIADGIVVLDRDGRVQQLNPAAAELLEVAAEDCLGRVLAEVKLDGALRDALLAAPGQEPCAPRRQRVQLSRRGRVADVRTMPLVTAGGSPAGSFAVLADATAEQRVQELKHHYLNVVAHELRTPLTALNSFASVLGRGSPPLDPRQQRVLSAMEGQLLRLERQIDKLLLLAELERGSAAVREPFLLAPMVEEALAPCRIGAREKGLQFEVTTLDPTLEVFGNADDLRRALAEVAENAVKFTPAGGNVDIAIEAHDDEAVVRVRDSGIGIASEHHETIFLGFRQLEDPLTRAHAGSGLGLSLAKRMVEASGGTIAIESALQAGSIFTLRLPIAPAAVAQDKPVAPVTVPG